MSNFDSSGLFYTPPSVTYPQPMLLSQAIKASKPSRTKEVFSLTPVSRDAFSNILSSMFSVVLICINYARMSNKNLKIMHLESLVTGHGNSIMISSLYSYQIIRERGYL